MFVRSSDTRRDREWRRAGTKIWWHKLLKLHVRILVRPISCKRICQKFPRRLSDCGHSALKRSTVFAYGRAKRSMKRSFFMLENVKNRTRRTEIKRVFTHCLCCCPGAKTDLITTLVVVSPKKQFLRVPCERARVPVLYVELWYELDVKPDDFLFWRLAQYILYEVHDSNLLFGPFFFRATKRTKPFLSEIQCVSFVIKTYTVHIFRVALRATIIKNYEPLQQSK